MRRSFFAYVYNKGEQKLANTVRPYDLYYTNVGDGAIFALQKYDVLHTMYDKPAEQKRTNHKLVLFSVHVRNHVLRHDLCQSSFPWN